jgi:hypothetical protein
MNAEYNPEQLAIANLALHFLPRIELPHGWQTEHPDILAPKLAIPTAGIDPENAMSAIRFPGWATPFELIAEEAVKRARILLDAAAGKARRERTDYEHEKDAAEAERVKEDAAHAKWQTVFQRYAKDRAAISMIEALRLIVKGSEDHMLIFYMRQSQRESYEGYRERHHLEKKRVIFADEEKPGETDAVVVSDLMDEMVDVQRFGRLAASFRQYYDAHGERVRKMFSRIVGQKGGEMSAEKRAQALEADAVKYGGDASVTGSHKRRRKPKPSSIRKKS